MYSKYCEFSGSSLFKGAKNQQVDFTVINEYYSLEYYF